MLLSKYSTRLSYVHVSQFHLGPATTLASLLLARAILQIFEATFKEMSDRRDPPFPLQDGRSSTANCKVDYKLIQVVETYRDCRKGDK